MAWPQEETRAFPHPPSACVWRNRVVLAEQGKRHPLTSYNPHRPLSPALQVGVGGGTRPSDCFRLKISGCHRQRGPDSICLRGTCQWGSLGTPRLVALWPQPPVSKKPLGSPWKGHSWFQRLETGTWEGPGWSGAEGPFQTPRSSMAAHCHFLGRSLGAFWLCPLPGGAQKPLLHPHGNLQQCCGAAERLQGPPQGLAGSLAPRPRAHRHHKLPRESSCRGGSSRSQPGP